MLTRDVKTLTLKTSFLVLNRVSSKWWTMLKDILAPGRLHLGAIKH